MGAETVSITRAGADWQELPAQTVREWCLTRTGEPVLTLEKVKIKGRLCLADALINRLLRFIDCEFSDVIDLTGSQASAGIHLLDCKLPSLEADRLSVQGDLVLERIHSKGLISLCGARLTGHLRCTGSEFRNAAGKAFNGRGIIVGGSALFDGGFSSSGEFILASAQVGGSVDMTGASLENKTGAALTASGIRVGAEMLLSASSAKVFRATGTVQLWEARVAGRLQCSGGRFCATSKRGMAIDAGLIDADEICLNAGFIAIGEVFLDKSTVNRRVDCERGKFCNPGGVAFAANGLVCKDVRLCRGFAAAGEVQLMGARISYELNCSNGKIFNQGHVALIASGLICDGKVYFNEQFVACGEVRLSNARIKTELNCTDGAFAKLKARGMTCEGNVYLNGNFQANMVELMNATVNHDLNCRGGKFEGFDAQRITIGANFDWRPRNCPKQVNVSFADVGLLQDNLDKSWPGTTKQADVHPKWPWRGRAPAHPNYATSLTGFIFRNLNEEENRNLARKDLIKYRIGWLSNASYAPDGYARLAHVYWQQGHDREARKIAIAGQRDRRRRGGLPWTSKLWNWFLDFTVKYGYGMHRPLIFLLLMGVIGGIAFQAAQHHGLIVPVSRVDNTEPSATTCTRDYPCFYPYTYAFEIFLPVINLRQLNFWLPTGISGWGMALLVWVWVAIVLGWMITVAIAAGIGHLFSQRD